MRPAVPRVRNGTVGCLHSPLCRGLKVFVFQPRTGLALTTNQRSVRMFAKYKYITVLAIASVPSAFGNFAGSVVAYDHGVGFAKTFSGVGYTNASAAVGQPNRNTSFGPMQPFNPPFDVTEIVSLGTNGSLVLR